MLAQRSALRLTRPSLFKSSCHRRAMSRSNSFAALADAEQVLQAHEEATSTSGRSSSEVSTKPKPARGQRIEHPLVWVDLEMTGLDIDKDTVIEIAVIITDGELRQEVEGPALAIHQSEEVLGGMNAWCIEHHGKSGLTQRVRDSTVDMAAAQELVLAFVREHVPDANTAQLAGNSVHVDRMFLNKFMPDLVAHLNYRIVDVSSIKELARRWYPQEYRKAPRKVLAHTALSDIKESISELKYYRDAVFKPRKGEGKKK